MKKIIPFLIIFFWFNQLFAQIIYLSTTNNRIYRLDILNCNYVEIVQLSRSLTDISFHPDGTLYGIANTGDLFVIDTITGATTVVHTFGGQVYNSLTASADGILYATGDNGALWSYNKTNNQATYYGLIGYQATGDLTFYKGNLYVAVKNDRIVLVDINHPPNSIVVIDENISGEIFGIVSYSQSCDSINCYAVSSGNSDIYEINFTSKSLQLVCHLNIRVGGGASTYEFFGSAPIIYHGVMTTNPTCNHHDGSITINVTGGIAPLTYSINGIDYQSLNTFDNLSGGNYQFIVSDANGCTIIEEAFLSDTDGPVIENLTMVPVTCGNNNGEIDITADGGNGAIEYGLDGGSFQTSPVFQNLSPGIHLITVQDTAGCTATDSSEITSVQPITINNIDIISSGCTVSTGSLIIEVQNSTGIQYSLDGINFQTSKRFDLLAPGHYLITILDQNGCRDTSSATIIPLVPLLFGHIEMVASTCGENNGSIIITPNGGSGKIDYSIDGSNFQDSNQFVDLAAGGYLITIRDENGCRDTTTAIIEPGVSLLIKQIESVAPRCDVNDGSILITPNGGTGMIKYSIDGIQYQTSNVFSNLGTGLYNIDIIDEAGCKATGTIEINPSNSLLLKSMDIHPTDCGEKNGSITLLATGGTGQLTFSLDGGPSQINTTFLNLGKGDHEIIIRDELGCRKDTSAHIGQLRCQIYIPNTFSPNQDGTNDYFQLFTSDDFNVLIQKYLIFDRWGNLVYSAPEFSITSTEYWWDGTYKRISMRPGVFAYYIEVEYEDGAKDIFKGSVTLVK